MRTLTVLVSGRGRESEICCAHQFLSLTGPSLVIENRRDRFMKYQLAGDS